MFNKKVHKKQKISTLGVDCAKEKEYTISRHRTRVLERGVDDAD